MKDSTVDEQATPEKMLPFTFIHANSIEFHPGNYTLLELTEILRIAHEQYLFVEFWTKLIRYEKAGGLTFLYNYRPDNDGMIHVGEDLRGLALDGNEPDDGNLTIGHACKDRWETMYKEHLLQWNITEEFTEVLTQSLEIARSFREFLHVNYLKPKIDQIAALIRYDDAYSEDDELIEEEIQYIKNLNGYSETDSAVLTNQER